MLPIDDYLHRAAGLLKQTFGDRLAYLGLQGSYSRGEADEHSDIDLMVVLDELREEDLHAYRGMLELLGNVEQSCGFLCGRRELAGWNTCEIGQLLHETVDIVGCLADLVPAYSDADVRQYVKLSVGNLYHALCHRAVHDPDGWDIDGLRDMYKPVFYILQNRIYIQTGVYWKTKRELLNHLGGLDASVLKTAAALRDGQEQDAEKAFRQLFSWCRTILQDDRPDSDEAEK